MLEDNTIMKILIIDTYYAGFLKSFWARHSQLINSSYRKIHSSLISQYFGTSDYYSYNLKQLGHKAIDIIANDEVSQLQWAKEHGYLYNSFNLLDKLRILPYAHRLLGHSQRLQQITLAQINSYKPDVVYLQDLSFFTPANLKIIKKNALLVGQIACPLPARKQLKQFDLILTSFPHYVPMFRQIGIKSEYFRIGFEPRVLKKVGKQKREYDVTFIGSFSPYHQKGTRILESLARKIPIHVWGQGLEYLSLTSPLRKNYHGGAWGLEMYKILAKSKIVINRHISSSGKYANNMRLYESTGMGAMLITDAKENLSDLFEIDQEVVTYCDTTDLLNKVQYYLNHEKERAQIARAGQKRTLREHTYQSRMKELVAIFNNYL